MVVPTEGQRGPARRRNVDDMPFELGVHPQYPFFFSFCSYLFSLLLRVNDIRDMVRYDRYHTAVCLGSHCVNHLCCGTEGDGTLVFSLFSWYGMGYNDDMMGSFPSLIIGLGVSCSWYR